MPSTLEKLPKSDTIKLRGQYIGKSCKPFYEDNPMKITKAEGQYMYDERGQKYLDCINNVAHVGHCHPDVVRAGQEQMALLYTNNRFLHDNLVICAKRLTSLFPKQLSVCYFVNSGSEANDLAIRLARIHTGRKDVIVLDHAYHGHLITMTELSPYKFNHANGIGKKKYVHMAPCPDTYRGKYCDVDYPGEDLGVKYADDVRKICNDINENGRGICAYIAESLVSVGGQILPPKNYFKNVYKHVREAGGVCIADEVQVGFGRVGTHMWAFQLFGDDVIPDIVTVAKPMGNGHPVAAVITTPEIAASFAATGIEYFNTYGGNPVSCAIALAVMNVIEREELQKRALEVGSHLLDELKKLAKAFLMIGDVRGVGLFLGIELVTDKTKRTPATAEAQYVVKRMRDNKIILSCGGPYDNILKLKPPMVFSKENADYFLSVLQTILKELEIKSCKEAATSNNDILRNVISSRRLDPEIHLESENQSAIANNRNSVLLKAS